MSKKTPSEKSRRRYGSYFWVDPKTNLGYAKVRIPTGETTASGQTKYKILTKRAKNQTAAEQIAQELLAEHSVRGPAFVEGYQMTFDEFAEWYKKTHAVPPVYADDGTRVSGMRTFEIERRRLDALKLFFGKLLIKNIDDEVISRYKKKREKEGKAAATVNRDLELLRAMFRKAVRRRWLRESPFDFGEKLVEKSLEKRRDVILTADQEFALLKILKSSETSLLYYAVLCLLDTGARPSETYDASTVKAEPVLWSDFFDYDFKAVKLTSYKGRQKLVRFAPVTDRLETAMRELYQLLKEPEIHLQIFPVKSFKTAWLYARRKTAIYLAVATDKNISIENVFEIQTDELEILIRSYDKKNLDLDVRLRDLRRNFASRLAKLGMENDLRQRILGHEQAQTTFDYTQADLRTAAAAKRMLDGDILEIKSIN